MIENYLHEQILRDNDKMTEFDIYMPKQRLVFEYQGEQHYYDVYAIGPKWYQKQRDEEKKKLCIDNDTDMIEIPYWWDRKKESLLATIHEQRLDMVPFRTVEPIPTEPPSFPNGKD